MRSRWGREPEVLVTIGLATLLGYNDDPAHLDRYGPIAAAMARDIAGHGVWRCAVVDDVHGTVLGLGKSTYRAGYVPGPALQHLTRTLYRDVRVPRLPDHRDQHPLRLGPHPALALRGYLRM